MTHTCSCGKASGSRPSRGHPDRRRQAFAGARARCRQGRDPRRQPRHRRLLEQLHGLEVHPERVARPGGDLGGDERVAAQLEEVVVGSHPVEGEQLGPDRRQLALDGGRRLAVGRRDVGPHRLRRRQPLAVHLAVGGERDRRQAHQPRRHHVGGERALEPPAQLAGGRVGRPRRPRPVGDQPGVAGDVLAHRRHRLGDRRVGGQRRLHLAQLDAEAAQLDLLVERGRGSRAGRRRSQRARSPVR